MVKGNILLVRADANSQIGMGHFMRCLALAQTWQEQGGITLFLMAPGTSSVAKRLEEENIREVRLSAQPAGIADANETAAVALRNNVAWVALDGYQFLPEYQRALKEKIAHLLLFDDLAGADRYHADLLLNQNAYATPEMYASRSGNSTLLLGAPYFLLRREFQRWRDFDRQITPQLRNLLVTFGGSDTENATQSVLEALALLPAPAMNVRVLAGANYPHRAELERVAAKLDHGVEFQTDSKRIAEEMAWADMAISAAGSTSWELAFMGLPSLLITVSEHQRGCARYLHENGIAISLGRQPEIQSKAMATALASLADDPLRRAKMSSRGRALIDGRGAERVVQAMSGITSGQLHGNVPLTS